MAKNKYKIATLGSHTALQILKGAKDEGFETICICQKGQRKLYESFGVADKIIDIDYFKNFPKIEDQLIEENAIIIPHGSFITYVGHENVKKLKVLHYGTKDILEWESDRVKERQWLKKAGLKLPRIFKDYKEIDRAVIIKFHGAQGGFGYFIANNPSEFEERIADYPKRKKYVIQEYIVGVPIYTHYFYSRVKNELEVMSFDKRYESNADSIGRIAAKDQLDVDIQTSYTITGNIPLVVRESLLSRIFDMGGRVVKTSQDLVPGGLFGPFCLEAILDPNLNFNVFEISARIVAGTNCYPNGSFYTWIKYNKSVSTGRRIAMDIKEAAEEGCMEKVLG